MVLDIITQLFGHSPNIHDIIIAVVSFLFAFILLPQLRDVYKGKTNLNLYTASLTTVGLIILTANFFAMGFWISFTADFFNSVIWALLFVFSIRNMKKVKTNRKIRVNLMEKRKILILYSIISLFLVLYGIVFVYIRGGCAPGSTCPSGTDVLIDAFLIPLSFIVLSPLFYYLYFNFKSKNKNKKLAFLVVGLIVVTLILAGWAIHLRYFEVRRGQPVELVSCWFSVENDTLIVELFESYPMDPFWEYIEISDTQKGNGVLPTGSIEKGDIITNCTGEVCLVWLPLEKIIYCSPNFDEL